MADYFESDEVVRGYDRKIAGRILSYLKPYKALMAGVAAALVLSTLGELFVPILQQKIIDDAIMIRFYALDPGAEDSTGESGAALSRLKAHARAVEAGGYLFVPEDRDSRLSRALETELREKGILDPGDWYAFRYSPESAAAGVVQSRPGIFRTGSGAAAILKKDLSSLSPKEAGAIRAGDISFIIRAVLLLFFILVFVFAFTFAQTWGTTLISQKVMKDIRLSLFKKTCSQSTAFLSRHPVGRIVTRLSGDVETINEFFSSVLAAFLKDLSVMAGVLITLFALSPKLALFSLLTLPPVLAITAVSRLKARDAFRRQSIASSRVNSYLSERLSGVQVVQLFQGEKKSLDEFAERNNELLAANLGEMYVFATFRPLVEWFSVLCTAIIIVAGGVMILDLSLSLGVLVAFINLIGMFYSPVMDIAEKYTLLQSAMAGGERVFALLDTDERISDTGTRGKGGMARGHIEFRDVRFSYTGRKTPSAAPSPRGETRPSPGGESAGKEGEEAAPPDGEVLKGLSFTVNPGETAAIVGYTGAGKTTIINVLTRLWDIDSGSITLDGIPIRDIPLDELRRSCLPVLQDVFLFSGTVADNIRLGLPLSDTEVMDAAKAVHAHAFITRLEKGYDTMLSEGASNISSGQRQLLSFARVIAHNPSIVILDEATSSIDTETEKLIQMGMNKVLSGRTSLVIAHRLSTIRHADRILVLSGGRLAEEGRHDELIARGGLYSGLYRLQYSEQPPNPPLGTE